MRLFSHSVSLSLSLSAVLVSSADCGDTSPVASSSSFGFFVLGLYGLLLGRLPFAQKHLSTDDASNLCTSLDAYKSDADVPAYMIRNWMLQVIELIRKHPKMRRILWCESLIYCMKQSRKMRLATNMLCSTLSCSHTIQSMILNNNQFHSQAIILAEIWLCCDPNEGLQRVRYLTLWWLQWFLPLLLGCWLFLVRT